MSSLSAAGLWAPASPTTWRKRDAATCWCWNARTSRAKVPRGRAWAECGPSSPRPSISACRSIPSLFVAPTPAQMEYLRGNYGRQVAAGLQVVRLLDAREVAAAAPELRHDDI